MSVHDYRVRIYQHDDSTVEFTYTADELVEVPERMGGQRVDPLRGRAESLPWSVRIVDLSSAFVADMSNTDGNADFIQRLIDVQRNIDAAGWVTLATGRIRNIALDPAINTFTISVTGELWAALNADTFTKCTTTQLIPAGMIYQYARHAPSGYMAPDLPWPAERLPYSSTRRNGKLTAIRSSLFMRVYPVLNERNKSFVRDDVHPGATGIYTPSNVTHGQFKTLRCKIVGGLEYEVVAFRSDLSVGGDPFHASNPASSEHLPGIWVYDELGTVPSGGGEFYVYAPQSDPSEMLPLHIGTDSTPDNYNATAFTGTDPVTIIKNIMDGDYQRDEDWRDQDDDGDLDAIAPVTLRYDSAAVAALVDVFDPIRLRATRPERIATILEQLCQLHGMVMLQGADGKLKPVQFWTPDAGIIADPDTLFEFNETNATIVPTWEQVGTDQVTSITLEYQRESASRFKAGGHYDDRPRPPALGPTAPDDGFDGIRTTQAEITERYADGATAFDRNLRIKSPLGYTALADIDKQIAFLAANIFDRFAFGPIRSTVHGQFSTVSVDVGDWVVIEVPTFPSVASGTRGSKVIAQVLSRTARRDGFDFEVLHLGASQQPLANPSCTAVKLSTDPAHSVVVTVSGLPAGADWEVHAARSTLEPAEGHEDWKFVYKVPTNIGTFWTGALKSGAVYWWRCRAVQVGRISSSWSTAVSVTMDSLSPPTGATISNETSTAADLSWTVGEVDEQVEVLLDGASRAVLPAGSEEYEYTGLTASTAYTAGVRHIDAYGGVSSTATAALTTTAVAPVCDPPRFITILAPVTPDPARSS